jgi:hypothetical protein
MSDLADLAAAVGLGDESDQQPPHHAYTHHQPHLMQHQSEPSFLQDPSHYGAEDLHEPHHHLHDDSVVGIAEEAMMVSNQHHHDRHHELETDDRQQQASQLDHDEHNHQPGMDHVIDHDATLQEAVAAAVDPSKVDPLALAQHKEQIFIKLYKDKAIEAALLKKKLEQKTAEVKSLKAQIAQFRRNAKANSIYNGRVEEPKATPTATEATTDDKKPAATISIAVAQNPKYQYKYVRHVKWEERFQELVQYKLKNGHCNVPKSFPGPLHAWVRKQRVDRKAYNVSSGGGDMCQERIDALDSIGFTWVIGSNQPNESKWQESFDCLIQFKLKEGHCSVPKVYASKLHKWVENQRHRRKLLEQHGPSKAKGMTWERVQKLEAIGFWENKKRQSLGNDMF